LLQEKEKLQNEKKKGKKIGLTHIKKKKTWFDPRGNWISGSCCEEKGSPKKKEKTPFLRSRKKNKYPRLGKKRSFEILKLNREKQKDRGRKKRKRKSLHRFEKRG